MSSGPPPAAIAIVRISGRDAFAVARAMAGTLPEPRRAAVRALRDRDGGLLDRALVLTFPGPRTATGEDLVEFHCHGGRAVVEAVMHALDRDPAVRRAAPGEFTRRALENGRIDLSEAEGLADLLEAETEAQRRAALIAAEGRVSRAVRGWLDRVSDIAARVEASIDYAEEGDVEADTLMAGVAIDRKALAADIAAALAVPPVERWRDGVRIVVAGPPNAGKSSLVNAMADREAAIVSPVAGTTRDRIDVAIRRKGIAYVLIDTAGLRADPADPVEGIGIDRARKAVLEADLLLWLGDEPPTYTKALWVHAKADIRPDAPLGSLATSIGNPASIEELWTAIETSGTASGITEALRLGERVREGCHLCLAAIEHDDTAPEIVAERLRLGRSALADALGANATEAMLDALFTRFCVGK